MGGQGLWRWHADNNLAPCVPVEADRGSTAQKLFRGRFIQDKTVDHPDSQMVPFVRSCVLNAFNRI